jgi:hypothetical protein
VRQAEVNLGALAFRLAAVRAGCSGGYSRDGALRDALHPRRSGSQHRIRFRAVKKLTTDRASLSWRRHGCPRETGPWAVRWPMQVACCVVEALDSRASVWYRLNLSSDKVPALGHTSKEFVLGAYGAIFNAMFEGVVENGWACLPA